MAVSYELLEAQSTSVLAMLRIVLALGAVRCYSRLMRHPESGHYLCRTRRMTFALFTLEGASHLLLSVFGGIYSSLLVAIKELSMLGVAFTQFSISRNQLRYSASSALIIPAVFATSVANVRGMDMDVLAAASITLILLSINNLKAYGERVRLSNANFSAKSFFTMALLSSYVFRFVATLLGCDLSLFVGVCETIAVGFGFYSVRHAVDALYGI